MPDERGKATAPVGELVASSPSSKITLKLLVERVERDEKPKLKGRAQHLGFCTALSAIRVIAGPDAIVFSEPPMFFGRCPDCRATLAKSRVITEAGDLRFAWVCRCDPEIPSAPEEPVEGAGESPAPIESVSASGTGTVTPSGGTDVVRELASSLGIEIDQEDD